MKLFQNTRKATLVLTWTLGAVVLLQHMSGNQSRVSATPTPVKDCVRCACNEYDAASLIVNEPGEPKLTLYIENAVKGGGGQYYTMPAAMEPHIYTRQFICDLYTNTPNQADDPGNATIYQLPLENAVGVCGNGTEAILPMELLSWDRVSTMIDPIGLPKKICVAATQVRSE